MSKYNSRFPINHLTYLNSVILFITNVDETKTVCCDSPRIAESSICSTFTSKGPKESSRRIEDLHPVVVSIRDDKLSNAVNSYSSQAVKFSFCTTILSEFFYKPSIGIKYLRKNMTGFIFSKCSKILIKYTFKHAVVLFAHLPNRHGSIHCMGFNCILLNKISKSWGGYSTNCPGFYSCEFPS